MAAQTKFDALRQLCSRPVVDALEKLVREGNDASLCRMDAVRWAREADLPEEAVIDTMVHASRMGLFDMSWNLLCPGCGGVLEATASLNTIADSYNCALCAVGYEPSLDEMVEVTFTVNPAVRRIAAHDPDSLSIWDYYRLMYFSNGLDLPPVEQFEAFFRPAILEIEEVPPYAKTVLTVLLPAEFVIIFEPITHSAVFIDVKGEAVSSRRDLNVVFDHRGASTEKMEMAPGPLRVVLENHTERRLLPVVGLAGEYLHRMLSTRRPFCTAKRLFTNQTFRDLYRTATLDIDQRLKIQSLTVLFTDLKGSTELYDRVGDLAAYDLVRAHFKVLGEVVKAESGAVVKTIGDAVMATFPTPSAGIMAAVRMREAMVELNAARGSEDLLVKIGLHEGPCLAVMSNERLDYFGQTVNIAARVQALATSHSIFVTETIVNDEGSQRILRERNLVPLSHRKSLRGIADELTLYEIP